MERKPISFTDLSDNQLLDALLERIVHTRLVAAELKRLLPILPYPDAAKDGLSLLIGLNEAMIEWQLETVRRWNEETARHEATIGLVMKSSRN